MIINSALRLCKSVSNGIRRVTCPSRILSRPFSTVLTAKPSAAPSTAPLPPTDLFDQMGEYKWKINMSIGAPSQEELVKCGDKMQEATRLLVQREKQGSYIFNYGVQEGDHGFRQELAKFLTKHYGSPVDASDLLVTSGATQGLYTVGTLMMPPGSVLFIEDPSYFSAIEIITKDFHSKMVALPMDADGIDVDEMERLIQHHCVDVPTHPLCEKYPYRAMVYLIPTYHNPTGVSLSTERCQRLVKLSRQYDLLLFCDDVYNLFSYKTRFSPARLYSYDKKTDPDYKGNVISNGTFSKIFAPGIRLGWMEVPEKVLKNVLDSGYSGGGGAFNNYTSGVMCSMLETGLMSKHVQEVRRVYASRMAAVCEVLRELLPPSVLLAEPEGGYFIWIELPPDLDASKLREICRRQYGISFRVGNECSSERNFKNCIRLCIAFYSEDVLVEAAETLAMVIKDWIF